MRPTSADRMPRQLSGGQAQRVALARALAAEPDVLLLDEPLAGLDVAAATAMRKVLRRVLARDGRSAVLITHDLLDVLTLADRVLVLESGRIAETGSAAAVLATPTQSVRRAVRRGEPGRRHRGRRRRADDTVGDRRGTATPGPTWWPAKSAVAVFTPAAVAVYRDKPHGSPRNTVEVTVAELDSRGPAIRVRADEQPDGAPGPRRRHHRRIGGRVAAGARRSRLLLGEGAGGDRPSEPVTSGTRRSRSNG